jgi:hypothetical protein
VRYLLLIANDERRSAEASSDQAWVETWEQFFGDLRAAGKLLGAERLRPSATATTVRQPSGRTLLSDGPFIESKEQLGGYFLIEAENLDEALGWAGRMPVLARGGCVEVRPIWERGAD